MDIVASTVNTWAYECTGWDVRHGAFWTTWFGQEVPAADPQHPQHPQHPLAQKVTMMQRRTLNRILSVQYENTRTEDTWFLPTSVQWLEEFNVQVHQLKAPALLYAVAFNAWVAYAMCAHLDNGGNGNVIINAANQATNLVRKYLRYGPGNPVSSDASEIDIFSRMRDVERLVTDPVHNEASSIAAALLRLANPTPFPTLQMGGRSKRVVRAPARASRKNGRKTT